MGIVFAWLTVLWDHFPGWMAGRDSKWIITRDYRAWKGSARPRRARKSLMWLDVYQSYCFACHMGTCVCLRLRERQLIQAGELSYFFDQKEMDWWINSSCQGEDNGQRPRWLDGKESCWHWASPEGVRGIWGCFRVLLLWFLVSETFSMETWVYAYCVYVLFLNKKSEKQFLSFIVL